MSRTFKTPKGTELILGDIKGKPYLAVQYRIVWFREEHPDWGIESECLLATNDETRFKAVIKDPTGRILADGYKREDKKGFPDHYEKAQTGAIGRALGILGYGTAYAVELEEEDRLADSPAENKPKKIELPPNAHIESIEANDDSYNYLIQAGSLEGKLIGEIDHVLLSQKLEEAKKWLTTGSRDHALFQRIKDFAKHADNYLTQCGFNEEEPPHPVVIPPKGHKASSGVVARLIKAYQTAGTDAHKLNEMLGAEFNESFPTLTEATAKIMLDRLH